MINLLKKELIIAMKAKDIPKKEVLQLVISKAQSLAKENKSEVTNNYVNSALKTELKQTLDSVDSMKHRLSNSELEIYNYKISIIEGYLPKQISDSEIHKEVLEAINNLNLEKNIKNMGKLMSYLKDKLGDTVDNKKLSNIVKTELK